MILFEVSHDFLQSGVILELKAVPESPHCLSVLGLRCGDGFRESEEWQSQVNETILIVFQFLLSADDLFEICLVKK